MVGAVAVELTDQCIPFHLANIFRLADGSAAALAQLSVPETLTFLVESGLPLDLLSISLLAATALKLNDRDSTTSLQQQYLPKLNVSGTTVSAFVDELAKLIKLPRSKPADLKDIF